MRTVIAVIGIVAMVAWGARARAADGRYQAIPLDSGSEFGTEKAMIIDTVAGHVWIWMESPAVENHSGGRYLIYQGQVSPGRDMGEILFKQEWPADGAAVE